MQQNSTPKPNPQGELAKERNRAAAERTLMAWIRTCLSLISFGFGINTIVSAILSFREVAERVDPTRLSRTLGLAFVALGTYAMIAALIEHRCGVTAYSTSWRLCLYPPSFSWINYW